MRTTASLRERPITTSIRDRIEAQGEALWQLDDFSEFPAATAAKALSRLTQAGILQRIAKGVYYRPGHSAFGETRPSPKALRALAAKKQRLFPAGLSAANLLGFSTQTPNRMELSTTATSVQRRLLGADTIVHTRRPPGWNELGDKEAALLEMLRGAGEFSELDLQATADRLLELLAENRRFEKLMKVAATEPPRVQAMLGAAAQELGKSRTKLLQLRKNLNPLSRFEFGKFRGLRFATEWQAKDGSRDETLRTS